MKYNVVGLGGTFDRLHAGHKAFLRFAFSTGRRVVIGLTSDAYIAAYKSGQDILTFSQRKEVLEEFLYKENFLGRYTITPLDTIFGPAIDRESGIEALIATEETKNGADLVNEERKKQGLSILPVVLMPLIHAHGERISSTKIRAGEIDNNGIPFIEEAYTKNLLLLPEELRETLALPFGELFTDNNIPFTDINPGKSVTVGDATTVAFHKQGIYPKLAVVDFTVQRKKAYESLEAEKFSSYEYRFQVVNPPGTIVPQLWEILEKVVLNSSDTYVIIVTGEEDLAVLPLVLFLPFGYTIFYGQPNKGMVRVVVTLEVKERVKSFLQQFHVA